MSDNLFMCVVILLMLSTCGSPDIWDASIHSLMQENCKGETLCITGE